MVAAEEGRTLEVEEGKILEVEEGRILEADDRRIPREACCDLLSRCVLTDPRRFPALRAALSASLSSCSSFLSLFSSSRHSLSLVKLFNADSTSALMSSSRSIRSCRSSSTSAAKPIIFSVNLAQSSPDILVLGSPL